VRNLPVHSWSQKLHHTPTPQHPYMVSYERTTNIGCSAGRPKAAASKYANPVDLSDDDLYVLKWIKSPVDDGAVGDTGILDRVLSYAARHPHTRTYNSACYGGAEPCTLRYPPSIASPHSRVVPLRHVL